MDEDKELEILKAKKLLQMRSKLRSENTPEKSTVKLKSNSHRKLLVEHLVDRGVEVLEIAERTYPSQTASIVKKIGELLVSGEVKGYISGGELLHFFRSLGLRIHVSTTINVAKDGKVVSLAEKLKTQD